MDITSELSLKTTTICVLASLLAVPAYAGTVYGTLHKDTIVSDTRAGFDLGTHSYIGTDIRAVDIAVTAPSRVDYSLSVYVQDGIMGWYYIQGDKYVTNTTIQHSLKSWNGIKDSVTTMSARLRIERTNSSNKTPLGGYVNSRGAYWN